MHPIRAITSHRLRQPIARLSFAMALTAAMIVPARCANAQNANAQNASHPAPALIAPLLDGQTFDLASARGHVVVIHFWASWCPPCRTEMPLLDRFARAHHEVTVMGLSFDKKRDQGAVRQAMTGLSFPTALASGAKTNGFGTPSQLPQTLVIDANGRIAARFTGGHPAFSEATLLAAVNAATAKP